MQSSRPTVLVVADDATLGAWVEGVLEAHGYRARRVPDAPAALRALDAGPAPCAILVDLALPGQGGAALWRGLRRAHADLLARVPVVALCGLRPAALAAQAEGPRRLVREPHEERRLLELLDRHCGAGGRAAS